MFAGGQLRTPLQLRLVNNEVRDHRRHRERHTQHGRQAWPAIVALLSCRRCALRLNEHLNLQLLAPQSVLDLRGPPTSSVLVHRLLLKRRCFCLYLKHYVAMRAHPQHLLAASGPQALPGCLRPILLVHLLPPLLVSLAASGPQASALLAAPGPQAQTHLSKKWVGRMLMVYLSWTQLPLNSWLEWLLPLAPSF